MIVSIATKICAKKSSKYNSYWYLIQQNLQDHMFSSIIYVHSLAYFSQLPFLLTSFHWLEYCPWFNYICFFNCFSSCGTHNCCSTNNCSSHNSSCNNTSSNNTCSKNTSSYNTCSNTTNNSSFNNSRYFNPWNYYNSLLKYIRKIYHDFCTCINFN